MKFRSVGILCGGNIFLVVQKEQIYKYLHTGRISLYIQQYCPYVLYILKITGKMLMFMIKTLSISYTLLTETQQITIQFSFIFNIFIIRPTDEQIVGIILVEFTFSYSLYFILEEIPTVVSNSPNIFFFKQYGNSFVISPFVRMGPNTLYIGDIEHIQFKHPFIILSRASSSYEIIK